MGGTTSGHGGGGGGGFPCCDSEEFSALFNQLLSPPPHMDPNNNHHSMPNRVVPSSVSSSAFHFSSHHDDDPFVDLDHSNNNAYIPALPSHSGDANTKQDHITCPIEVLTYLLMSTLLHYTYMKLELFNFDIKIGTWKSHH